MPVKVEVFTMGTQGRKNKVGYLLLSLLGAQPCPSNKIIDVSVYLIYYYHIIIIINAKVYMDLCLLTLQGVYSTN